MTAATAQPTLHDPNDTALAHTLGYAGLIPFVLLTALLWLINTELQHWVALALAGYAALIASFMGGVHWGIAWSLVRQIQTSSYPKALVETNGVWISPVHAQRPHLLWGVVPSLLAWPGLLMPPFAGLAWLGFLLLLCYAVDRRLYARAGLTHWLTLRFRLSSVAALSCFVGAAAL